MIFGPAMPTRRNIRAQIKNFGAEFAAENAAKAGTAPPAAGAAPAPGGAPTLTPAQQAQMAAQLEALAKPVTSVLAPSKPLEPPEPEAYTVRK